MRNRILISFIIFAGVLMNSFAIEISRTASPPLLDGKLDDECWKKTPAITDFKDKSTSKVVSDGTKARIAYDDAYLYLAFSCSHPHPNMMKAEDDGVTYKVHYDEHIELAISPDQSGLRLFKLQVNPRGIMQVIDYNKFGKADWEYGTFCRAETLITKDGWNLELAIPWLRIGTKKEFKKGELAINLARAFLPNIIDQYGVFTGYKTQKSSLSTAKPTNALSKYFYQLLPIKFTDAPPSLKTPFVVAIIQASVTDYVYRNSKCYYKVNVKLEGFSRESGKVEIYVDDPLAPEIQSKPVLSIIQGQAISPMLTALVECQNFSSRDLKLSGVDSNGNVIAKRVILSPAIFNVLNARLDRDYYTNEKNLNVVYQCHLPRELASKANLHIMVDENNKTAASVTGLSRNGVCALDISSIPVGTHKVRVTCEIGGKKAYDKEFGLIKKIPSEILEVKIDHERRGLLVNGKPFFPFGVLTHSEEEEDLEVLAKHGVNTVSPWFVSNVSAEGYKKNMKAVLEFIKKAEKYNIYVMPNLDNLGTSAAGLPSLKKFFPQDKQKVVAQQAVSMTEQRMKSVFAMGNTIWRNLPRPEKNQLFEELYQKSVPYYRLAIKEFRKYPNVIGYFYYDEPTLGVFDMNVQGKKLYQMSKQIDGYRPAWTLYSSYIPTGAAATDWIDCIGTDPYWVPPVTNPEGIDRWSINFVSRITANNKKRADEVNKLCWSIPMIENWSMTYKRLPTPEEFRCQSYLALIHGAKGLIYFIYPVGTEQAMNSLLRVGKEVEALTPWLLTKDIQQTPSKVSAPVQQVIRVNEQGDYVMLTANSRPWPVKFTINLTPALLDGRDKVQEFFTGEIFEVRNSAFTDILKPFAAKVYNLGKSTTDVAEIKVDLKIEEKKKEWRPEVVYTPDGRPGKRNILPNPSFEEASVPGVPDYYFCGRKDPYPAWGSPNSPWTLDSKEAYHGKKSLRIRIDDIVPTRNYFYVAEYIAPKHSKATKYMFSVYMKSDRDDAEVMMAYAGRMYAKFKVGKQWKRYNLVVTVPANVPFYRFWLLRPLTKGSTVWIDAAQMEKGDKLTDFEE